MQQDVVLQYFIILPLKSLPKVQFLTTSLKKYLTSFPNYKLWEFKYSLDEYLVPGGYDFDFFLRTTCNQIERDKLSQAGETLC